MTAPAQGGELVEPPRLIPIPHAWCGNCGRPLAWRMGVGRYVVSHSDGDDVCSRATARLRQEDRDLANTAYRAAERAFAARLPNAGGSVPATAAATVASMTPNENAPAETTAESTTETTEVAVEMPAKVTETTEVVETAETSGPAEPDAVTEKLDVSE